MLAFRRLWPLVAVACVVGLLGPLGGLVAARTATDTWSSTALLLLTPLPSASLGYATNEYVQDRANAYAALVGEESFQDDVAAAVGNPGGDDVAVAVQVVPDSAVIRLTATASDAGGAEAAVTAATQLLIDRAAAYDNGVSGSQPIRVDVASSASSPLTVSRSPTSLLLMGGAAGFILALAVAVLLYRRQDVVVGARDLTEALPGVPVGAVVTRTRRQAAPHGSERDAALDLLLARLTQSDRRSTVVVMTTGPDAVAGRRIVGELAVRAAGASVAVAVGEVGCGAQGSRWGLQESDGIEMIDLGDVLKSPSPSSSIAGELRELHGDRADGLVILVAPADGHPLAVQFSVAAADLVLLLVRLGHTSAADLRSAAFEAHEADADVLVVVETSGPRGAFIPDLPAAPARGRHTGHAPGHV